jgi:hypothetical protein
MLIVSELRVGLAARIEGAPYFAWPPCGTRRRSAASWDTRNS